METVTFKRDWKRPVEPGVHEQYLEGHEYDVTDEIAKAARKDGAVAAKKKGKAGGSTNGADNGDAQGDSTSS